MPPQEITGIRSSVRPKRRYFMRPKNGTKPRFRNHRENVRFLDVYNGWNHRIQFSPGCYGRGATLEISRRQGPRWRQISKICPGRDSGKRWRTNHFRRPFRTLTLIGCFNPARCAGLISEVAPRQPRLEPAKPDDYSP